VGPWPWASGLSDSHRSEVEEFLVSLARTPKPILGFGLVPRLGVAVEGREVASVGEAEEADGFLVGHVVCLVGDWLPWALLGLNPDGVEVVGFGLFVSRAVCLGVVCFISLGGDFDLEVEGEEGGGGHWVAWCISDNETCGAHVNTSFHFFEVL
jgi:hypothetical protein